MNREKQILGALLYEPKTIPQAVRFLISPAVFDDPAHRIIFREIIYLWENDLPLDQFAVIDRIRAANELEQIGGPVAILEITSDFLGTANLGYNLQKQAESYMLRTLGELGQFLVRAKDYKMADGLKTLERAEDVIAKLGLIVRGAGELPTLEGLLPQVLTEIEQQAALRAEATKNGEIDFVPGLPTGIKAVDDFTLGLFNTELTILAARPGMGKTSLALQIAKHASLLGNVAFFSLEMGKNQLVTRMLSEESQVNGNNIRAGRLNDSDFIALMNAAGRLEKGAMVIDDTGGLSITELKAKAFRIKETTGLNLIVVDYLQLMTGSGRSGRNRENEVGEISRGLKILAKDLQVPVLALSQLNREVNKRANKKPDMSDLRESGSIEQDADHIWFIHRPGYFGKEHIQANYKDVIAEIEAIWPGYSENVMMSISQLIIAKNRFGSNTEIPLIWRKRSTKFEGLPKELKGIFSMEDIEYKQPDNDDFPLW